MLILPWLNVGTFTEMEWDFDPKYALQNEREENLPLSFSDEFLKLFFEYFLDHLVFKTQVSKHSFQPAVLGFQFL
jgi:hypothetical protein